MDKQSLCSLKEKYKHFFALQKEFAKALETYQAEDKDFIQLRDLYASDDWFNSREDDKDSEDFFTILGEDYLYHLFVDHSSLLEKIPDQSAKMYQSL